MTRSYDYWKRREDEARENTIKDEERYNRELEEIYKQMFDEIEKDINDFFTKYAKQESISITEAKKRVSKLDMVKYERKAKKYVAERDFSEQANEEMRIYNLTMKVNRLEMLKANIGLELVNGYQDLEDYLGRALNETVRKEIKRQAGILGETAGDNKKYADSIVNASFLNATWSERIWNNQEQLKHELHKTLSRGLIQGRNPIELARELRKTRDVSVYDAERLLRTEMCRVQIAASLREIKANGFTQYVFLADDRGSRTCEVCQSMNGRTFKIEDGRIGVNLPPLHPNCRCSVAGHIDDDEFINWLEDHGVELTDQDLEEMGLSRGSEREEGHRGIDSETTIDRNYINSNKYRRKMRSFGENDDVTLSMERAAVSILNHRQGSRYEDIAVIDGLSGKTRIRKNYNSINEVAMDHKQIKQMAVNPRGSQIVMHNHPGSSSPSDADIYQCAKGGYKYGVILCHNGEIISYRVTRDYQDINYDYISRQFARIDLIRKDHSIDEDGHIWDNAVNELKEAGVEVYYV